MKHTMNTIKKLQATNSSKEKVKILKENESDMLKKVLYYCYNPYLRFKVTEKTLYIETSTQDSEDIDIFSLLDLLSMSNINDSLRLKTAQFLGGCEEWEQELYKGILLKDLKIKCNTKSINKAFPSLIPEFNVMLAEKYWDYMDRVVGKNFTVTMKMDGHRCVAIKENGIVKLFTRQGQPYEQMVEIEKMLQDLNIDNMVIDGELLVSNYRDIEAKGRYKATSKILRTKGEKKGITLVAFDFIPLVDFKKGGGTLVYSTRRKTLEDIVSDHPSPFLEIVEKLYHGSEVEKIQELLDEVTEIGEEGVMVNIDQGTYKLTRTPNILKVKKMLTADVRVVDVYEGERGKEFEGTLGGVTIEFIHNEEVHRCNCGSGFSVAERHSIWANPSTIIGKIIELNYFEVSTNDSGTYGLRFPIFKGIREDKFEISMA